MNKLSLTIQKKTYILLALLIVGIGAGVYLGILPALTQLTEVRARIHDQRVQLAVFDQERSNIEETRRDYNSIESSINELSQSFITETDLVEVIATLEDLAKQNNVEHNLSIITTPDKNADKRFAFNMIITGNWSDVLGYVADLERLQYYVLMHDLHFTTMADAVSLTFKAESYAKN